jgi:hypothetical protein
MAAKSSATSKTGVRPSDVAKSVAARSASCFGSSHSFCWSATAAAGRVSGTGERSGTTSLKTRWTSAAIFALFAPGRRESRTRLPSGFPTLAELLWTPSIPVSRASTGASRSAQPARVGASRPSRNTCSRPRLASLVPATPAKLASARLAATRSAASQATRRACRYLTFPADRTLNPTFALLRSMGMSPHRLHLPFPSLQSAVPESRRSPVQPTVSVTRDPLLAIIFLHDEKREKSPGPSGSIADFPSAAAGSRPGGTRLLLYFLSSRSCR